MKVATLKDDFCFKEVMENEIVRKHFISDVLGIPLEKIKSVRVKNPGLWKRWKGQKQGIVDLLLELNDDTKINVEIQIRFVKHWKKRTVFYLAKMYMEDLRRGEKYAKAKKCIAITIVDFNVSGQENYHNVYRLRDENGVEYTDELELHTIELRKKPRGDAPSPLDEWHCLFNIETEEEMDMLNAGTKNSGIMEAIKELREIGLIGAAREMYEAQLKAKRDHEWMMDSAYEEGLAKGKAEDIIELLEDCGEVSQALREVIYEQTNLDVLKAWHKLAARAESVEEFEGALGLVK